MPSVTCEMLIMFSWKCKQCHALVYCRVTKTDVRASKLYTLYDLVIICDRICNKGPI